MKPWWRHRMLAAGCVLLLFSNVIVLGNVWWNREGVPESELALSQRELVLPYPGGRHVDNSGLALRLSWRVAERDSIPASYYSGYANNDGAPRWLDSKHMATLGFRVEGMNQDDATRERYRRQLPRDVLLVLELDGPAWTQVRQRAQENAVAHAAAAAANPGSKEFADRARSASAAAEREEHGNSRLFAIDAGLDRAALRAKYPDRTRYMIVPGSVRPVIHGDNKKPYLSGHVHGLGAGEVNIPFAMRSTITALLNEKPTTRPERGPRFEARLATGRRLESWITAISLTGPTGAANGR